MEYETVIGLEVHAELSTESKLYCGCKNEFGREPNTCCCPICTGMPGTLPSLNEKAVEYAVKMGCALGCTINRFSRMDRKNYFYPDLPKAYQISQFAIPLCEDGYVDILMDEAEKRIGVTRIHIEEDAGKLMHGEGNGETLVDFNRCGVPLIEIVSEPDLRSAGEARAYLGAIKAILHYLDICDCKMQEGSLRCDVNVSVRQKGSKLLGKRCEMKNVNSFSAAVHAIEYESARQISVLASGGEIFQETRRWDEEKGRSEPLRSKEEAKDYRFFPEPDLPPIVLDEGYVEDIRASLPELPGKKITRYMQEFALSRAEAELLAEDRRRAAFFDEAVSLGRCGEKLLCNWLLGELARLEKDTGRSCSELGVNKDNLTELLALIESGSISNAAGKTVFEEMRASGKRPAQIVDELGLAQISEEAALEDIAREVLVNNAQSVKDYRGGRHNALGFLVGQCIKATKGRGNPSKLKELLLRFLSEDSIHGQ